MSNQQAVVVRWSRRGRAVGETKRGKAGEMQVVGNDKLLYYFVRRTPPPLTHTKCPLIKSLLYITLCFHTLVLKFSLRLPELKHHLRYLYLPISPQFPLLMWKAHLRGFWDTKGFKTEQLPCRISQVCPKLPPLEEERNE